MVRAARKPVLVVALVVVTVGLAATIASAGNGSAATASRPVRVALVFDLIGPQSQVSRPSLPGLKRAVREFGNQGTAITPTVKAGLIASFLSAGRQGYDLVIAIGALAAEDAERAARQLPGRSAKGRSAGDVVERLHGRLLRPRATQARGPRADRERIGRRVPGGRRLQSRGEG